MAEQKKDVKSFVEGVFSAENQSAASLSEQKLGKYNNIAVKMFHTGVLTSKEMLIPAFADLASKILQGVNTYRKLYQAVNDDGFFRDVLDATRIILDESRNIIALPAFLAAQLKLAAEGKEIYR